MNRWIDTTEQPNGLCLFACVGAVLGCGLD